MLSHAFLESPQALDAFVAAWESCTLPKSEWTHAAHVAVCAYHAARSPATVLETMRDGIRRFNDAVGTPNTDSSGYHETLTRFWCMVILEAITGIADPWRAACVAVERFGERRDLHRSFYSFDVVRSVEARRAWIAPDLTARGVSAP